MSKRSTIKTTMTASLTLAMLATGLSGADARGFGGGFGGFGGGHGFGGGFAGSLGRSDGGFRGIAVGEPYPGRSGAVFGGLGQDRLRAIRTLNCWHVRYGGHPPVNGC